MLNAYLWPYAAKAIIQHEWDIDHLNIWLTFHYAMNIKVKPANTFWTVYVDTVSEPVVTSVWQDTFTMLLTVEYIAALPDRVTVKFDGPSPLLETVWHKQWEPWAPILSMDVTT